MDANEEAEAYPDLLMLDDVELPFHAETPLADPDTPQLRSLYVRPGVGNSPAASINAILQIMRLSGIQGVSVNSTYRPGANDYHGRRMAVDFGGNGNAAVRDRIATFLYQFKPNLLELIHSHTQGPPYKGWYVKNGKTVNPYGPASAHWNHVHVAIRLDAALNIVRALQTKKPVPKPAPLPKVYHTVVAGDTLTSIAKKYGKPVSTLVSLNNYTTASQRDNLGVGQKVRVR